ncbi:MAG: hypothetical protein ACYS0H_06280, partial [Planctomycetota bacterium]
YVRQEDGTYRKTTRLVMQPGSPGLDFNCGEDYMVTTQFGDVTYAWPRGRGALSDDFSEIRFNGPGIRCVVKGRRLSINGKAPVEFEPGDHVRITPEGEVFVNDDARQ